MAGEDLVRVAWVQSVAIVWEDLSETAWIEIATSFGVHGRKNMGRKCSQPREEHDTRCRGR